MEILSPSTRRRDIRIKSARYAQFAVPHYWIVDPDLECVGLFQLEAQSYELMSKIVKPDTLVSPAFPDLQIPLTEVFE